MATLFFPGLTSFQSDASCKIASNGPLSLVVCERSTQKGENVSLFYMPKEGEPVLAFGMTDKTDFQMSDISQILCYQDPYKNNNAVCSYVNREISDDSPNLIPLNMFASLEKSFICKQKDLHADVTTVVCNDST